MIKKGSKIKVHLLDRTTGEFIQTEHEKKGTVFEVKKKNDKFGINWMEDSTSMTRVWYNEDGFVPLDSFCNVEFEEVME